MFLKKQIRKNIRKILNPKRGFSTVKKVNNLANTIVSDSSDYISLEMGNEKETPSDPNPTTI